MNTLAKVTTAIGIAAVTSIAVAAPAQADPWDGSDVEFGLGLWDYDNDDVNVDDVNLVTGPGTSEYTDIWDAMGVTSIDSVDAGLNLTSVNCVPSTSVDVEIDATTGDLVYSCVSSNPDFAAGGLAVASEVRIYAASDLVRVATFMANTTASDIVIDEVEFDTDFGSSGEIWGYQGQDDAILPVPAAEDTPTKDALAAAGAQWSVHHDTVDAPGGVAWGNAAASAPASITSLSGDRHYASVSSFTLAAGEEVAVAYFALWNPATLLELDYTNSSGPTVTDPAADALVVAMDELNTFSGRLTVGLEGVSVVNWGPIVPTPGPAPAPEPQLAATGSDVSSGVVGMAALLLAIGAGAVVVSVRRRSATR